MNDSFKSLYVTSKTIIFNLQNLLEIISFIFSRFSVPVRYRIRCKVMKVAITMIGPPA